MKSIHLVSLLVALLPTTVMASPLSTARKLLYKGEYAKAEQALTPLTRGGAAAPEARVLLARLTLLTGRPAVAVKWAERAARGKSWAAALTVKGAALQRMGKLSQAEATLRRVVAKRPRALGARMRLALVYREQGKAAPAKQLFDGFYDDYGADKIDKRSAEQLTYVAMACRYTDNFRDASDTLGDAVKQDPKHVEAWLEWAEISLEKYEAGYAEQHYKKALAINPHHPRALVGLARVKLVQSYNVDEARALLRKAREVDPRSLDAAVVEAEILIDAERNREGEAILTKALTANPRHLPALSMMAASFFLRDDPGSFKRMQARVLKLNPTYTAFFRTVVRLGVRHHRYQEAIGLSKQAVAIDPQDWYSLADLGTNYLRLGNDAEGLKYLREAWKGDPFNVRNFNLLNLFEDVVAKEYVFIRSPHFKLRVHRKEKAVIQRVVVPQLERAYARYVKKYRFKPVHPIVIELFRNPQHYAVRTVGVPGLGALGVCFGRVITATSPLAGRFNWGQVLWHELNHVFTIQLSRSRVPRWLTEGLADLEPILERPEWKRENDRDIYMALSAHKLRGVAQMSTAFSRAKDMQEMVVAYYQGSRMTSYLIDRFGMDKVLAALKAYGKGKRTTEVLPKVTGVALDQLDSGFRAAERKRLAYYAKSWHVDGSQFKDLKRLQAAAKQKPTDARAQAGLAMALLVAGKADACAKQADLTLKLDPKQRLALFARSQVALARGKLDQARALLQRVQAAGGDGYDVRLALGKIALKQNKLGPAAQQLSRAKSFDPERSRPYFLLAQAYAKAGRTKDQIEQLKGFVRLEQQLYGPVAQLVRLLIKQKDYASIRTYAPMAVFINPGAAWLHQALADALARPAPRPDLKRAVWQLETALLTKPDKPAPLLLQLARLQLKRGDRRAARKSVARALEADPKNAEARALRKRIK